METSKAMATGDAPGQRMTVQSSEFFRGEVHVIVKFLASGQATVGQPSGPAAVPQTHSLIFDPANVSTESMDLLLEFMTVKEDSFWVTPDPRRKKILAMERHESVDSLLAALQRIKQGTHRRRQTA